MTSKPRRKKKKSPWTHAFRRLRHAVTVPALETARWLIRLLPHGGAIRAGALCGGLAMCFASRERNLAQQQLLETGVASSPQQARAITRGVFRNLGSNLCEWLHSTGWSLPQLRERVELRGAEHLARVTEGGKGAILVTGHFGNWELMVSGFVHLTPHKLMVAMTEGSNRPFHEWIVRMRGRDGALVATTAGSGLPMIRHLKGGHVLAVLSDQDTARVRGEFVQFFGRPAHTPSGAAFLAWRLGLAIVPLTIERDAANPRRHIMGFHEPILPRPGSEEATEVPRLTQAFTTVLEQEIRRRPGQWVWIHNRWKRGLHNAP